MPARMRRRDFVSGLTAIGLSTCAAAHAARPTAGDRPLRLLILGGTGFLGPHVVEAARRRRVLVTLFNRGRTNPGLFRDSPGIEQIQGDRDGGLVALAGRRWDAVLDTSAFVPRRAREAALLLRGAVQQYIFTSSISVYGPRRDPPDEATPTAALQPGIDPRSERVTDVSYGPLKALCEQEIRTAFGAGALLLRLGQLVGPGDPADHLTYWAARCARGGPLLVPGRPSDPVQFLDVRDLAEWIVSSVAARLGGTFNVVGPASPCSMGQLIATCNTVGGRRAGPQWVSTEALRQLGFGGLLAKLPLWQPPESSGLAQVVGQRARERGLHSRPMLSTVRDTLAWLRTQPPERQSALRAGPSAQEEAQALLAIKQQQATR